MKEAREGEGGSFTTWRLHRFEGWLRRHQPPRPTDLGSAADIDDDMNWRPLVLHARLPDPPTAATSVLLCRFCGKTVPVDVDDAGASL